MTDRTRDFKQALAAVRKREDLRTPQSELMGSNRLARKLNREAFAEQAFRIFESIRELRRVLADSRRAYISSSTGFGASHRHSSLFSGSGKGFVESGIMNEVEKDALDADTHRFLKSCSSHIETLKTQLHKPPMFPHHNSETSNPETAAFTGLPTTDLTAHRHGIILFLYDALQRSTKLFQDMKGVRLQKHMESQRWHSADLMELPSERNRRLQHEKSHSRRNAAGKARQQQKLTAEEIEREGERGKVGGMDQRQLQEENEAMMDEFDMMNEQVRDMESKLTEIATLSNLFSSKIAEQCEQIESLHTTAVENTENIRLGNRLLDQAGRRGVDFRMFVLLVMVIASVALLFLDWFYS